MLSSVSRVNGVSFVNDMNLFLVRAPLADKTILLNHELFMIDVSLFVLYQDRPHVKWSSREEV